MASFSPNDSRYHRQHNQEQPESGRRLKTFDHLVPPQSPRNPLRHASSMDHPPPASSASSLHYADDTYTLAQTRAERRRERNERRNTIGISAANLPSATSASSSSTTGSNYTMSTLNVAPVSTHHERYSSAPTPSPAAISSSASSHQQSKHAVPSSNFISGESAGLIKQTSTDEGLDNFPEVYSFKDRSRVHELVSGITSLYEQRLLTDVILCVESSEFPCHRCVMASSSPYFHAMFTNDLLESKQERIKIGGVEAEAMQLIINYCYTSKIDITADNVQSLLVAANMFQMYNLRDACACYMEKHVALSNCIGIYFYACSLDCKKLQELAKALICENFNEVCREEEYLSLSKDKVIDLIMRDELNVDREEIVYESAIAWVKHELESRRVDLFDILSNVRFALISPYYIHDVIERERIVYCNKPCMQLIESSLQYHMLRDRRQDLDLSKLNTNTRKGMPVREMVVFLTHHSEDIPDVIESDTYRIKALPDIVEYAECVVTGENNIFVAGRQITEFGSRRVYSHRRGGLFQYDHFDRKWLPRAAMNQPRSHFRLAVLDGMIYSVGGTTAEGQSDVTEFYNPHYNQWRNSAPLIVPVKNHSVAVVGGALYCIGGESGDTITDAVQRFNPRYNSWNQMSSMILPRTGASAAVFGREIYVVGGSVAAGDKTAENMLKSVEIYNPERNDWRFGPELPEGRFNYSILTFNGSLYVFGGETDDESVDGKVWRLDTGRFGWKQDKTGWPIIQLPYYCVAATMSKDQPEY
ncbi:kelch-like protein diablo isoform X2 [Anneissia japonica]|uniref:kelch-like protein diablo isoform X2 n=1 Tax=Anneissia japonica TaxID=1529436 RepID=UPI00142592D3|nr:kelch-like protein diablo isoform X2 [Anneissia japonica]XP_033109487.1 kelch-like protein diablo isoform X2 [Anneissia japonica]